jgi:hypothetical protein
MPQDILSAATEQAEQSDPPVKAAALLCAARVLTAFDQAEAARVLERGIALATALSELDRSTILKGAPYLSLQWVSPQRALRLTSSIGGLTWRNGQTYLRHAESRTNWKNEGICHHKMATKRDSTG